jgi:type IX secretion system substrate protein
VIVSGSRVKQTSLEVFYLPQANLLIHQSGNALSVGAGGTLSNNRYTWFHAGSTDSARITGDYIFNPTVNGNYYAKITNAYAKQLTLFTDTVKFTKATPAESVAEITVNLFPNPVKNILTVKGLDTKRNYNMVLTDDKGNIMVTKQIHTAASYRFNVQYLRSGVYYVKAVSDKIIVAQLKFEKQ